MVLLSITIFKKSFSLVCASVCVVKCLQKGYSLGVSCYSVVHNQNVSLPFFSMALTFFFYKTKSVIL